MTDRYCCIKECFNTRRTAIGVSFFRFPRNRERCMQWVENCKRQDLSHMTNIWSSQYLVCGHHFEEDCFADPKKKNLLLKNAVPTLFTNTLGGTKLPSRFKGTSDLRRLEPCMPGPTVQHGHQLSTSISNNLQPNSGIRPGEPGCDERVPPLDHWDGLNISKTEVSRKIPKKENQQGIYFELEVENNTNARKISKCKTELASKIHKKGNEENEYGIYYEIEVENNTNPGKILNCTNEFFTRLSRNLDHCEDQIASENSSTQNHQDQILHISSGDEAFSSEHFMAREIDLAKLPKCWAVLCNPSELAVFKMRQETVLISIKITGDGTFSLKVLNSDLAENHPILHFTPVVKFSELLNLLHKLDEWTVCSGNSHKHFLDILFHIKNTKNCRVFPQTMSLHSTHCHLLFPGGKGKKTCAMCKEFHAELRKEYL